jgi:PIN domain nuclease of toxin-antitoxin system
VILLDTHVLLWARATPERLSEMALNALMTADEIAVAAISLWEIAMLAIKGRVEVDRPLAAYLDQVAMSVFVLPLDATVAARVSELSTAMETNDPADHMICATAEVHGLRLISADRSIRSSRADVVW